MVASSFTRSLLEVQDTGKSIISVRIMIDGRLDRGLRVKDKRLRLWSESEATIAKD